jgi:hypothetical protein
LAVGGEVAAVSQRVRTFGAVPLAQHGLSSKPLRADSREGLSLQPKTFCRFPNPRAYPQMAETPVFGLFCAHDCAAIDLSVSTVSRTPTPAAIKGVRAYGLQASCAAWPFEAAVATCW